MAATPRDLIDQAISLADYRGEPHRLTDELLSAACASYFVDDPGIGSAAGAYLTQEPAVKIGGGNERYMVIIPSVIGFVIVVYALGGPNQTLILLENLAQAGWTGCETSCDTSVGQPHFLSQALRAPARYRLVIERTSQTLVETLEVAGDSEARRKGLLGRDRLDWTVGFVIAPTQGVHTFRMRFAIDVVGVARDGRVVKIRRAVAPGRLVFVWTAFAILELSAGAAERSGLIVGDRLVATTSPIEEGS